MPNKKYRFGDKTVSLHDRDEPSKEGGRFLHETIYHQGREIHVTYVTDSNGRIVPHEVHGYYTDEDGRRVEFSGCDEEMLDKLNRQ